MYELILSSSDLQDLSRYEEKSNATNARCSKSYKASLFQASIFFYQVQTSHDNLGTVREVSGSLKGNTYTIALSLRAWNAHCLERAGSLLLGWPR